jgi:hypothetical protein
MAPASFDHAQALARRMRQEDAAEVLASGGYTPLEAVLDAMAMSSESWAAYAGEELLGIWGVVPGAFLEGGAIPWLLTTEAVPRHRRAFLATSRRVADYLVERYGALTQQVDARYDGALRWAARIGFAVEEPAPFGRAGLPFCRITMRRETNV